MITKTLKTSLFIVALASFSFAGAQEKQDVKKMDSEKMFKQLDTNADDKITFEEYKAKFMSDTSEESQLEMRFKKMDLDGDGFMDKVELKSAMKKSKRKHINVEGLKKE